MGPRDREAFAPGCIALARPGPGGNVETSPPFIGLEAFAHRSDGTIRQALSRDNLLYQREKERQTGKARKAIAP